ncbi:MAG TPA: AMP-dependent synthetase/ligase [Steroidobacteraceae bacterium]|nr:AMP-dependent synthetase/ligase [Steroidobacteraceae bacterium]
MATSMQGRGGGNAQLHAATLCEAFQATVAQRPEQLAHRTFGGGLEFTFAEYAARVRALAGGLHTLGIGRGDTVGLMLTNRPEFNLADTAAMHLGATPFSVYNTSSPEQLDHVFRNAQNRVIVTERRFLPNVLEARTREVEHVVLVDGDAPGTITLDELARRRAPGFDFDAAWRSVEPDDVVTLIYTSGTTGPPKAAQLSHAGVLFQSRAVDAVLPVPRGGRGISYLPSAHVGDRVLSHYSLSICSGMTVTSVADHRQVGAALPAVRPTLFGGVPRVWEKLKAGLELVGIADPARLPDAAKAAVRARIGLDQAVWCISAAAPIATDVLHYFNALGLPLLEGWGMSELSCFATLNPPHDVRVGSVGRPMPGVELRVLDDGELLVRAPLVMKGYRGDPVHTAEALDAQGWLHTGDVARIDDDGYVTIVDRKKELIINSAGKNMSPANIEHHLRGASSLIAHAVCIGDRRPYNTALFVLDPEASARLDENEIRARLDAAVAAANSRLSRVEQIKRFAVLPGDWQPGGDELTPTSKLKRRVVLEKYGPVIEDLYR